MKNTLSLALLCAAVLFASCSDEPKAVLVTEVIVTPATLDLKMRRDTMMVSATVLPENDDNQEVLWSSENPGVASVTDSGRVVGVGVGETTIYARSKANNRKKGICMVTVTDILVESVAFEPPALSLEVDKTAQLNLAILPEDATYQTATWFTNDDKTVSVDDKGVVKALKAGSATITAIPRGNVTLKAECVVTVTVTAGADPE